MCAEAHLEDCPDCRSEIDEVLRVDGALTGALRKVRGRIPGPSSRDMDLILTGVRTERPEAALLKRIRRTVNRMLWMTLLVLSFLMVCGLLYLLLRAQGLAG